MVAVDWYSEDSESGLSISDTESEGRGGNVDLDEKKHAPSPKTRAIEKNTPPSLSIVEQKKLKEERNKRSTTRFYNATDTKFIIEERVEEKFSGLINYAEMLEQKSTGHIFDGRELK